MVHYHGFEIKETRFIKELNCSVNIYHHTRSGARLLHIDADDENKVFSVAFRTPPADSTGVAHILEHSVLCGSHQYPAKEPFVELLKGSLYTFLNAFTASDYTCYPIASMNDKDFQILMEVYLDAVFFPNIHQIDEIFYQEGWHYEYNQQEDSLNIKGVVYNEMKGAFSSPARVLFQKIDELIFPDTVYRNCSGGNPCYIPDLSLEDFCRFHKQYYHPANSYFILYGKLEIENILTIINEQALKKFIAKNIESSVQRQEFFLKPVISECTYPIDQKEQPDHKTWFALSYLMNLPQEPDLRFSWEVITHLLLETPAAPLKNALLQAGICKDVFGRFDGSRRQPTFTIILKDSELIHREQFFTIFTHTLHTLCEQGIDKLLIEASINIKEFYLREADHSTVPKGFGYMCLIIPDWIHDGDPIKPLCYDEQLEETRASLTSNFYEHLIKTYLLENNHYAFVTMLPEQGLIEKNELELQTKLKTIKDQMSEVELNQILSLNDKLIQRQQQPDKPEDLEKIPVLQISDVNPKAEDFTLVNTEWKGINVLEHNTFTNGIVYLNLYFETKMLEQELLPYAKILENILGGIHTKNYHYTDLSNLINIHTGGIDFSYQCWRNYQNEDHYRQFFVINCKSLVPKIEQMVNLITEITRYSLFTDEKRILEILNEMKSYEEMRILQAGHLYADNRLDAYITETGKINETIQGLSFYFFLKNLLNNYEQKKHELVSNLQKIFTLIFNQTNLYISITSPKNEIATVKDKLQPWIDTLPTKNYPDAQYLFHFEKNEAFILPSMVQYVAKGYSFKKLGYEYSGSMSVLNTILQLDYLWNKIRVQGGAYGANLILNPSGMFDAVSYRDPNLVETLKNYDGLGNYLHNIQFTEREFSKYIIGAVRGFDTPKTPLLKSTMSDRNYFVGRTQTLIQKQRNELLASDLTHIKSFSTMVNQIMEQNYYCVIGAAAKLEKEKELFTQVINVFE